MRFAYIPTDKIDISIQNVRKTNPYRQLDELAESIKEIGIQQPVVVFKKKDKRYELIIGQRRYLACKKLGFKKIPAVIITVRDKTDAAIKSFSENIHRLDLEYRDKMDIASVLLGEIGSVDKVAKRLGVSSQTVKNYLGYAAVPEPIKEIVDKGKLSASMATRIAQNIPDEQLALRVAERISRTHRSEERKIMVDIAHENPNTSPKDIFKIARERAKLRKITIYVTDKVFDAIVRASKEYGSDKENVTKEALEEWLKKRGFME